MRVIVLSPRIRYGVTHRSFHTGPAFHDADILATIPADTSDTRNFLKLFLRQAERHADILATILARMSASWNADLTVLRRAGPVVMEL